MNDTTPFKRLLVGLDDRGLASPALVRGLEIAASLDAEIDLVHAVEVPPTLWPGISREQRARIHASALQGARTRLRESLASTLPEKQLEELLGEGLRVDPGHPAKVILKAAIELDSKLILLGPHEKRPALQFGSTTRAVLSHAECPVWIQAEPPDSIRSLLVPIDFSEHSRAALACARVLAEKLGAGVRVLHCWSPPAFAYSNAADAISGPTYVVDSERDGARSELETWVADLDWGPVKAESVFVEGFPAEHIRREVEKDELIVMGSHGRTGLSRFLIGSVAQDVIASCKQPVLVVPDANRTWLLESDTSSKNPESAPLGH